MPELDFGDDDGFAQVTIGGATVRVDVYEAENRVHHMYKETKDQPPGVYLAKVAEYLVELGFPAGLSHRMADRFIVAIYEAFKDLEKKVVLGVVLPGSTASTPENGPAASLPVSQPA